MSVWATIGEDVGGFLKKVSDALTEANAFYNKVKAEWSTISGPTVTAASTIFYDAFTSVTDAESAAAAAGTGNVAGAIQLSETTWTQLQKFVADVKAGEAQAVADAKTLGLIK